MGDNLMDDNMIDSCGKQYCRVCLPHRARRIEPGNGGSFYRPAWAPNDYLMYQFNGMIYSSRDLEDPSNVML